MTRSDRITVRSAPSLMALALTMGLAFAAAPPAQADGATTDSGYGRLFQIVTPGHSIQDAIDRASPGGWVFVLPGTYRETADATNGLDITKGIKLIGLSAGSHKVVLENSGGQRNGIAAVPSDHTDCMGCHTDLAPPFPLRPGVDATAMDMDATPMIHGLMVSGITIQGFDNNGFFARMLDGYVINDVHSVDNPNYGIFPTQSKNGIITHSSAQGADDTGIWVETSQNVRVSNNLVEDNVNGFEVSNSEDILLEHNEVRGNTIGMAILFLPDIFHIRPDAQRITVRGNHIHDNNKPNTAREGAILSIVPPGVGILNVGVDDSLFTKNVIENNDFLGIGVVDYCLAVLGTPFDCGVDPDVTPGFVAAAEASNNQVTDNLLSNNGTNPEPSPFQFAASDLALLTAGDHGNCYDGNIFSTFFSLLGVLPSCP